MQRAKYGVQSSIDQTILENNFVSWRPAGWAFKAVIRLGLSSAQFVHKNGTSRIIYVRNVQFAHPFSYFIKSIVETQAFVFLNITLH